MENKIISIDITPDNSAEYTANAGVMWEHNATVIKFNIDKAFVGDYRYYIEYRSLMGTKVRTEYLELNTEDNTITYNVPVTMSSLKGVDCWFNIVSIDSDGNTQQIIKSAKFTLTFDYSPDTDNHLCKVNDFSINSLLEAIRLGTFKGDKGDKGDTGAKGDKGDKGDRGDDGEVTAKYVNNNLANAIKGNLNGDIVVAHDVSPIEHQLKCKITSEEASIDFSEVNVTRTGKNLFDISKVIGSMNNGDGTLTVKGTGVSAISPNTLKDYAPSLKVGETYTLFADTTSTKKYIYLKGDSKSSWFFGAKRIITENDLNAPVGWYADTDTSTATISNIQIELGKVVTEYEEYHSQKVTANAEGIVEGLTSFYPNIVLTTDAEGVLITCEYNKDINKVIENLVNAINSLGGNV